jgi:hypothetical protein
MTTALDGTLRNFASDCSKHRAPGTLVSLFRCISSIHGVEVICSAKLIDYCRSKRWLLRILVA